MKLTKYDTLRFNRLIRQNPTDALWFAQHKLEKQHLKINWKKLQATNLKVFAQLKFKNPIDRALWLARAEMRRVNVTSAKNATSNEDAVDECSDTHPDVTASDPDQRPHCLRPNTRRESEKTNQPTVADDDECSLNNETLANTLSQLGGRIDVTDAKEPRRKQRKVIKRKESQVTLDTLLFKVSND